MRNKLIILAFICHVLAFVLVLIDGAVLRMQSKNHHRRMGDRIAEVRYCKMLQEEGVDIPEHLKKSEGEHSELNADSGHEAFQLALFTLVIGLQGSGILLFAVVCSSKKEKRSYCDRNQQD